MAERILLMFLVYALILLRDYKRLSGPFNWREQGVYLLLIAITLYSAISYMLQLKLPFIYEAAEAVFAVPAKKVAAWLLTAVS
ncbi:hypothetical protein G9U52_14245 [Paenibacillus sp. S3N08]|uniref:Uncharacterized protein n=2 Tax=Paenibacillus agricola TaxID=2716264 RepID=A0ABX0J5B2_9BACL|nr:hypothetical protein [Paenibacillus agricola]